MVWHGPQKKGAKRELRRQRHMEAEARNEASPHEKRKIHRKGKCKKCS